MAKYISLKEEYDILKQKVYRALKVLIAESNRPSKKVNLKSISISIDKYIELVVIDDKLTFIDHEGYHYLVKCGSNCTLESLIDIVTYN